MGKEKKYGFSLMEMLVVMLIAAVVFALSAPMITKKMGNRAGTAGSVWTSLTGGNIGFNMKSAGVTSIIGGDNNDLSTLGSKPPKLTIGSKNNYPHIGFLYNETPAGTIFFKNNSSLAIGNNVFAGGENTIAAGHYISAIGSNTAILGANSKNTGENSVVIGFGINNKEPDTIVLGNKDTTVVIPGTVKFSSIGIGDDIKFDFNKLLNLIRGLSEKTQNTSVTEEINANNIQIPGFTDNTLQQEIPKGTRTIKINGKTYYFQSDKRLKSIISENSAGIEELNRLKVYNYTFKNDNKKNPHVGVIAQDLQKVFPNAVKKDKEGYLQIRFEDMFYAMINSIKELDKKTNENIIKYSADINDLKKEVNYQKAKLAAQEKEINRLKQEINDLKKVLKK